MDLHANDEAPVQIVTSPNPSACVIWLHGLGADGHDFESLVPELHLPISPGVRFVFPHAPMRPVTINGGYIMRAWYDIAMTEHGIEQNADHVRESQILLQDLIREQVRRGIPPGSIVLAGFSQGGTIALHTGLRYPETLAGLMSLSAPVPFADTLMNEIHPANAAVPVFMAHGTQDQMVPFASAEKTERLMGARGLVPEWRVYAMGHSVIPDEIRDISRWLGRVLVTEPG